MRTNPFDKSMSSEASVPANRVRWRSVAIPAEHGGWGMLLSPILLGLLVAPSITGVFLALINVLAFLARTPLKIVYKDRQRGRQYARTAEAIKVLGVYVLLLVFSIGGAIVSGGPVPLLPAVSVLPLAAAILYFDLLLSGRQLVPQLMSPVVLSAVASGMTLAAGWDWAPALAIWAIPLMREIPAVLFVRARLRLDRDRPAAVGTAIGVHFLALLLSLALARANLIPWLVVVAIFILATRAVFGLSPCRRKISVKRLGWSEIVLSLMTVALSAIGYWIVR